MRRKSIRPKDDPEIGKTSDKCALVRLSAAGALPVFVKGRVAAMDSNWGEELLDFEARAENHGINIDISVSGTDSTVKELDNRLGCEFDVWFVQAFEVSRIKDATLAS